MFRLTNPQMRYDWGSVALLPELLGTPGDGRPLAEIWMGAHPSAPSRISLDGRQVGLDEFVTSRPEQALGADLGRGPGAHLPFLLKLLAADRPLSLQVHPTREQAAAGFRAEDAAGIAPDDPSRNYRDSEHKPEMLYALTPFELMAGFRPVPVIRELLAGLRIDDLAPLLAGLDRASPAEADGTPAADAGRPAETESALRSALTALLTAAPQDQRRIVEAVVASARTRSAERVEYARVGDLARDYPGDVAIVASLFLNYLHLVPGDAVFVGAGMIHSYVRGLGVELMATSDNVLRAGLTAKHVDTRELLHLVDFAPGEPARLHPIAVGGGARRYTPPVEDFALWVLAPELAEDGGPAVTVPGPPSGARIALCCAGLASVTSASEHLELRPGQAAFIPAGDGPIDVSASGTVVVACQP